MKAIICGTVAVVLLGAAVPGNAQTLYFNAPEPTNEGYWGTVTNWHTVSCSGDTAPNLPQAFNDVVICSGETCDMDLNPEVETVTVESSGVLNIPGAYTLTLNEDEGTSTIDGRINLTGEIHLANLGGHAGDEARHTFDGGGDIVGTASGAKILIERNTEIQPNELINSTTIRGILEIGKLAIGQSPDDWQMLVLKGGTVHADDAGTLLINVSFMKDDLLVGQRSLLKVSSDSNAILQIDVWCPDQIPADTCRVYCLEYTDAEVFEGTLDLDTAILTEGDLTMEPGGIIDVDATASVWFRFPACVP